MPSPGKGPKKPTVPWSELSPDVLEAICMLLPRDRFKMPLVCRSWRDSLANAGSAWAAVTVDPRKKASTSRRIRFNKNLPTPEAVGAWFARYGRHVRLLHLCHLDAASQQEGCIGPADVAALLKVVAHGLRQLCFRQSTVRELLSRHADDLRCLQHLTSLHFDLPPGQHNALSLGSPHAAFITCLTALEDLGIASGHCGLLHQLPASLAVLPSLRSLQLARLSMPGEPSGAYDSLHHAYTLTVASCLTAMTALERLSLRDFYVQGEEDRLAVSLQLQSVEKRLARALFTLPRVSSLLLSDIGLGLAPPPPRSHPVSGTGMYPLPPDIAALADRLHELSLLEHTCSVEELSVLSALTALTALRLSAKHRRLVASEAPEALSCLTSLQHLCLSHGLTQVPACITGLPQLTFLDLSFNQLRSLKPGPYLKRLVAVNLRANAFAHFPQQLRVARHTAQELHLPQNDAMTISEKDVEQLATFDQLQQLTIYGASEEKTTRRNLALLQKRMPFLLIDV